MKGPVEFWKKHPDIPGIEVSTLGRVRTLDRVVSGKGNGTYPIKGQVLKPFGNGHGYLRVGIQIDGKRTNKYVHRLVAQIFIPNHDGLPEINHKDNNPLNNNVSNLEWCTHEYNIAYKEKYGTPAKNNAPKSPVYAINLATLELSHFRSQCEASRSLGFRQGDISKVIKGNRKQTHGFWFTNADEKAENLIKKKLYDIKMMG